MAALRIVVALTAFAISHRLAAAEFLLTTGEPADVDMAAAPLLEGLTLFRQALEKDELRGVVLLVARRGRIVLHEALGLSDRDQRRPFRRDALVHVASNTKPVVAALALQLAEEGKLDLDADVGRYVPAFDTPAYRGVTVRRLLSHTSGLRLGTIFLEPLLAKPSLRSEVERFASVAPAVAPGTSYSYNNPGYNLAGAAIEAVAGQPLETLLRERFYVPLGMRETVHEGTAAAHEAPVRELLARRVPIYRRDGEAWTTGYWPGHPPRFPFVRASGGMVTTAADYARFLQMMLNEGRYYGHRLLSAASVATATAPQTRHLVPPAERPTATFYGYGWHVDAEGRFGHGGSDGTYAWCDPRRELLGIVFTQSPGGKIPREEFRQLVEQSCRD